MSVKATIQRQNVYGISALDTSCLLALFNLTGSFIYRVESYHTLISINRIAGHLWQQITVLNSLDPGVNIKHWSPPFWQKEVSYLHWWLSTFFFAASADYFQRSRSYKIFSNPKALESLLQCNQSFEKDLKRVVNAAHTDSGKKVSRYAFVFICNRVDLTYGTFDTSNWICLHWRTLQIIFDDV